MNKIIKLTKRIIKKLINPFYNVVLIRSSHKFKKLRKSFHDKVEKTLFKDEEFLFENRSVLKLINLKISQIIRKHVKKIDSKTYTKRFETKQKFKTIQKNTATLTKEIKAVSTDKLVMKLTMVIVLMIMLLTRSFSWFYNEYISNGALFNVGSIEHEVKQYNADGEFITEVENPATIVYESNMGVTTVNTKYLEVKNVGSLDMEYNITFQLDGTVGEAGVMWYRLYEVTADVNAAITDVDHDTKLKAYADQYPTDPNAEYDAVRPVTNMTTITNYVKRGTIAIQNDAIDPNPRYYRLDYGMYQSANSSLYSGKSIAVHTSVYSTQIGLLSNGSSSETYVVATESELREAIAAALSGDTIKLVSDINIAGSITIPKRINLDTNERKLVISGDLVYDFVETGELTIDTSGDGILEVGNDLYINTPKTEVDIIGNMKPYDIYVGNNFTVSGIQSGEAEGILLQTVAIIKNKVSYIPVDVNIKSNTRFVVAPDILLGYVKSTDNATNIEIINNGTITQIQLQNMNLLPTFTKPQIYVYNLGTIVGVLGGSSIILPATATPYIGPMQGNTLIIKGATSSDITVEGSENFNQGDIEYNNNDDAVRPIPNEDDSYIIYIKEAGATIEQLLTTYFTDNNYPNVPMEIASIKKLIVNTINGQYMNNTDFDFLKSNQIPLLNYLDLDNARVKDGTTLNRIKDDALSGKTTIKTLVLPRTLSTIGVNAFYNVPVGYIPASDTDAFHYLTIPGSVTSIGDGAFSHAKYVAFKGNNAPAFGIGAFDNANNGTKFFVPVSGLNNYRNAANINNTNIFQEAYLSDNRQYFVFDSGTGVGIAYFINDTTVYSTLNIPTDLTIDQYVLDVNTIGHNAYRHVQLNIGGATLNLPSTVKKIDYGAFYGLNITSATLTNIETVGDYAFYDTNLATINASNILTIGNYSFYSTNVQTLVFTNTTSIGSYAFGDNQSLYSVNFANVSIIGSNAFYDCKNISIVRFEKTQTKMVLTTEEIDIAAATDALFSNWGFYIDGRLRVYVPDGISPNGNTYLQLYKNKFAANAQYIYLTGESYGSYTHLGLPYSIPQYTVRQVTVNDYLGNPINGYEIISYQGADLDAGYIFPETLTIAATTLPVVSVGPSSFVNSKTKVGDYVDISSSNLLEINKYAFYNLGIYTLTLPNVVIIKEYGLANTNLREASFTRLTTLENYALYNNQNLASLNLGNAKIFGTSSVADAPNLARLYLLNTDLNTLLVGNPFNNTGVNSNTRYRIYVTGEDIYIDYYKSILTSPDYVYATGYIYGSYTNSNGYNIGQYTIRQVVKNDYTGTPITGWEIIDYHGANLQSSYQFPTSLTYYSITYNVISVGREAFNNTIMAGGQTLNLVNNFIINIGDDAFFDFDGLYSIEASQLRTIGTRAFMNTDLNSAKFIHLYSVKEEAFANLGELYSINLGTVKSMETNSLYNLDKLSRVYFIGSDANLSFAPNAINDVGSLTSDHIRFYTTDGNEPGGTPYVDLYRDLFGTSYQTFFYREGISYGTFNQPNIPYDIGEYTIRQVTITNHLSQAITGWEIIEYHGQNVNSAYNIPVSLTAQSLTRNVISVGEYAYIHTEAIVGSKINISNNNILNIGKKAFYQFTGINSFISDNAVNVGESAFEETPISVAAFKELKTVGASAFANCVDLNKVDLGKVTNFPTRLLYNTTSLMQLYMRSTAYGGVYMNFNIAADAFTNVATTIGDRFRVYVPYGIASGVTKYTALYKATLPANLVEFVYGTGYIAGSYLQDPEPYDIGEYMVVQVSIDGSTGWEIIDYHGTNITTSYSIPDQLTANGETKNVISIGEWTYKFAVLDASNTWAVILPDTVVYVGDYAYYQKPIVSVTGNLLFDIGTYAFAQIPTLTNVKFNGVKTIKTYAFYLNTALVDVAIGINTTNIGNYAFFQTYNTNVLARFELLAVVPPTIYAQTFPATNNTIKTRFYIPYDSYNAYRAASSWNPWRNYFTRLNTPYLGVYYYEFINNGTEIKMTEYRGTSTTIVIPENFVLDGETFPVTAIGDKAFDNATNLRNFTIPRYVTTIGNDLTGNSRRIRTIDVDANNTVFASDDGVLYSKDMKTLIKYPDQKVPNAYTFYMPDTVEVVATSAFSYNYGLDIIYFSDNIKTIAHDAFVGASYLYEYHFPPTTPPAVTAFLTFPYRNDMEIYVPTAALTTYRTHYAYMYYSTKIYGE